MCGVIFQLSSNKINIDNLTKAAEFQKHRGPDFSGSSYIKVKEKHLYFSHQRLSILDLSDAANQPMVHEESGSTLIFNGEIYNYLELKKDLEKFRINFKTTSDTEILFYYLIFYGPKITCKKINGMWSFVFFDSKQNKIFFSRDRCGKKPLYYFQDNNDLFVASEMKTLAIACKKKFKLNKNYLYNFLELALVDLNEDSLFQDIKQFKQGYIYSNDLNYKSTKLKFEPYWNLNQKNYDFLNLEDLIYKKFLESVKIRLRSDVNIGIMLSGGIDSSAIASVIKNIDKNEKYKLLSFISDSKKNTEIKYVKLMEKYLNNKSSKVKFPKKIKDYFDLLEEVTNKIDVPLPGSSNLAHYLMMKEAKSRGLTVILSGQGADESLCGYNKYLFIYLINLFKNKKFFKFFQNLFIFFKRNTLFNKFNFIESKRYINSNQNYFYGSFFHKLKKKSLYSIGQTVKSRQIDDIKKFSIPSICHLEDRLSMLNSIEIRYPFLDYKLVELFVSLSDEKKIYNGWSKYIFRKTFDKFLPKEIVWRKDKIGFATDFDEKIFDKSYNDFIYKNYFNEKALIFKLDIIEKNKFLKLFRNLNKKKYKYLSPKKVFSILSLEIWLQKNIHLIST